MVNEKENVIDVEVKENEVEVGSDALKLAQAWGDPKLRKKMEKTIERHEKWEEFKKLSLKDKAKKIAKPVGIVLGTAAVVAGGAAIILSKTGHDQDLIEGECEVEDIDNEPWNYAEMEGFKSEPEVETPAVE